ncbi:YppG family protein [Halalkalibacillus halophilus]|uniref:YppG family protein n=1 Tax=Halalkalibacillus halophilus TaxID=392827 RepID=UPI0003FBDA7A|nr:YppG family protein [Halalkalibacillus halophilus]
MYPYDSYYGWNQYNYNDPMYMQQPMNEFNPMYMQAPVYNQDPVYMQAQPYNFDPYSQAWPGYEGDFYQEYSQNFNQPYNQAPFQPSGGVSGIAPWFYNEQGEVDLEKVIKTATQVAQMTQQFSPILKSLQSFIK